MKLLLSLLVTFGAGSAAMADVQPNAIILSQSAAPCSFWTYFFNPSGAGGYLCSSYNFINIPDAGSVQTAVSTLESRIERLEMKIKALEQAAK